MSQKLRFFNYPALSFTNSAWDVLGKKRKFRSVRNVPRNWHLHILHSDQFTTDYMIIRCESPSCLKLGRAKTPSHSDLSASLSSVKCSTAATVPQCLILPGHTHSFIWQPVVHRCFASASQFLLVKTTWLSTRFKGPLSHKKWAGDGVYEPTRHVCWVYFRTRHVPNGHALITCFYQWCKVMPLFFCHRIMVHAVMVAYTHIF